MVGLEQVDRLSTDGSQHPYLFKHLKITIMTSLKNSVQLIGRLGNDPQIRSFESGKQMATFSLATNESYYNNKGEKVNDTQWHNIIVWGKKAQVVDDYLKKGSEIALEGKLVNRSYEKEGEKKFVTEIVMNELLMIDKKA
jgi:single-strand DNA-binding protein